MFCFLTAAVMAGMAGQTWLLYQDGDKYLEQMYQDVDGIALETESSWDGDSVFFEQGAGGTAGTASWTESRTVDVEALKRINPDVAGWIQIPGTVIDYPVMYTPDNPNYYFDRDFYGRRSAYGMIYLDGTCAPDEGTQNLLLYGHHMRNGAMFASIENYRSGAYQKEHPVICLTVGDGRSEYEVMAAVRVSADQIDEDFMRMLWAGNEEQFGRLMAFAKQNALYETGVAGQWPDSLITLTTCEYTQKNGRFLLIARKKY